MRTVCTEVSIPFLSGLSLHRLGLPADVSGRLREVSIPFLSGLSLHPCSVGGNRHLLDGFNPLPIGAVSASPAGRYGRSSTTSGFNPLPIGAVSASDERVILLQGDGADGFNPLPIGAVSASVVLPRAVGEAVVVSIPFLSGLSLHLISMAISRYRHVLLRFNPLPIGAVSASGASCRCMASRPSSFNPLPIGAVSASNSPTISTARGHTVSIPFLSGLSLHPEKVFPFP